MVVPIIKPEFSKLDFLIYQTSLIAKIMVFVNKMDNEIKIAIYLCLLLLSKDQKQENILIKTFYSNFKTSIYFNFVKDF